jgi:hypothetical protein
MNNILFLPDDKDSVDEVNLRNISSSVIFSKEYLILS